MPICAGTLSTRLNTSEQAVISRFFFLFFFADTACKNSFYGRYLHIFSGDFQILVFPGPETWGCGAQCCRRRQRSFQCNISTTWESDQGKISNFISRKSIFSCSDYDLEDWNRDIHIDFYKKMSLYSSIIITLLSIPVMRDICRISVTHPRLRISPSPTWRLRGTPTTPAMQPVSTRTTTSMPPKIPPSVKKAYTRWNFKTRMHVLRWISLKNKQKRWPGSQSRQQHLLHPQRLSGVP